MAKYSSNTSMPVDTAISIEPGVTHKESDFQGAGKNGFEVPPVSAVGKVKGDRGWDDLQASMPREHKEPLANMKKGAT